jgi:hypothetical protein
VHYNQAGNTAYNAATEVTSNTTAAKANASINVTPYTVTYNGSSHMATGTATGVNGEDLATLLDLSGTTHTNAGNYATDAWTFGGNTNYNSTNGTVADKINQADAVCTITPYSAVYDGAAHKASGSCTGVDAGATAAGGTLDLGASFTNVPGGTATWHFTGGTNYRDQSDTVAITITKANATFDVQGYSGAYDGAAHGATGTAKGVLTETLAGLDLGMSYTNVPGGTAHWVFTDVTGNYNNGAGDVAITITKANATFDVQGYSGAYDGAAHGATRHGQGRPHRDTRWPGSRDELHQRPRRHRALGLHRRHRQLQQRPLGMSRSPSPRPMRRSMSRATLVRMTARRTAPPARPRASSPRHSLAWISG